MRARAANAANSALQTMWRSSSEAPSLTLSLQLTGIPEHPKQNVEELSGVSSVVTIYQVLALQVTSTRMTPMFFDFLDRQMTCSPVDEVTVSVDVY